MDKVLPTILIVAVTLLAFSGMYFGWRARIRRQSAIPRPPQPPVQLGEIRSIAQGLYAATTLADQPLERVAVHGLGFRSRATLTVSTSGIVLELTGQQPVFIAQNQLRSIDRASWAIDTAVETAGLLRIGWRLGEANVDSYLRLDNSSEAVVDAAQELVGNAL